MSMTIDKQKVAHVDLDSVKDIQAVMTAIKRSDPYSVILKGDSKNYLADFQDLAKSGISVVVSGGTKEGKNLSLAAE